MLLNVLYVYEVISWPVVGTFVLDALVRVFADVDCAGDCAFLKAVVGEKRRCSLALSKSSMSRSR